MSYHEYEGYGDPLIEAVERGGDSGRRLFTTLFHRASSVGMVSKQWVEREVLPPPPGTSRKKERDEKRAQGVTLTV